MFQEKNKNKGYCLEETTGWTYALMCKGRFFSDEASRRGSKVRT